MSEVVVSFRGGPEVHLSPPDSVVFGRRSTDSVVGLDPEDRSISSRAGAVTWTRSGWQVVNLSTNHPLFIEVPGNHRFRLGCARRFALCDPALDVVVEGRIRRHAIAIALSKAAAVDLDGFDGDGPAHRTETEIQGLEALRLNDTDHLVLVAMVSRRLKRFPHRGEHPLSYEEIAVLLGSGFSLAGVRRRIDRVRNRFRDHEIYFDGPRACDDLADFLIDQQLLGPTDLRLLERHLELERDLPEDEPEDWSEDEPGGTDGP